MRVAVIVPALEEELCIGPAHASASEADERIVADGGSSDGTCRIAAASGARVMVAPRGRARQMNAAAALTDADALVFLHADCRLPAGALAQVRESLGRSGVVGGAFQKRFASRRALLRHVRWRGRLWWALGCAFGDQALFVRREAFLSLGGFDESAAAEDLDLFIRLGALGRRVLLKDEVEVSARRLESAGILRTWVSWWRVGIAQAVRTQWRRRFTRNGLVATGE